MNNTDNSKVFVCHGMDMNKQQPTGSPNFRGGVPSKFSGVGGLQFSGGGGGGGLGLHRNTVNVRPVRILLECILVFEGEAFLHLIRIITVYYNRFPRSDLTKTD